MAKSAQKIHSRLNLNLLYPQGMAQKLPIRFLKWLISYGRFIVVIVEILVLSTFAFRFKLDADLANLKEKINEQVPFIESLGQDEALIKQTQQRLAIVKKTYAAFGQDQKFLPKISTQTPTAIKFTNFNIEQTEIGALKFKISAQTNSIDSIAFFLKGLRNDPDLKDINLTNINFEQGSVIFSITGATK